MERAPVERNVMCAMEVKEMIGEYVIINEYDKPCTRLVAQVVSVEGDKVKARYITEGTTLRVCESSLSSVTPVSDFGVLLIFEGSRVSGIRNGESIATYRDGKPRYWQPENTETHALRST